MTIEHNLKQGQQRTITANRALNGYAFNGWTGNIEHIANPSVAETIVTMPDHSIEVTSNYIETATCTPILTNMIQNNYYSLLAKTTYLTDGSFSNDGTKFYVDNINITPNQIHQFNLSVPWDITTSSYSGKTYITEAYPNSKGFLRFYDNGTKATMMGGINPYYIFLYTLSIPWDISTLSYVSSINLSSFQSGASGHCITNDGTKMYWLKSSTVYQYSLTVPYDITTAVYDNKSKVLSAGIPNHITVSNNGKNLFFTCHSTSIGIHQLCMSSAFDISTCGVEIDYRSTQGAGTIQDSQPSGVFINPDETKMFLFSYSQSRIYEYSL